MRIAVLWKRRYMGQDVITDRYARLYELPRGLAEAGHQVVALCLNYHAGTPVTRQDPVPAPGSLTWHGWQAGPWLVGGLPGWWRALHAELTRLLPELLLGGSDAVHAVLTRHLARRLGIPYVLDLYDNYEAFGLTRLPGLRPLYRRALRDAAGIVAVSDPLAAHVRDLAPGVPVMTLESTIDPARFQPQPRAAARARLGLPDPARLLGVSGSLHRSRGIGQVYETFTALAADDPTLHLALAGDLDRRAPPPPHPRIHWLGRLPHDAMATFFSALDLALIPMIDTDFGRYAFPQKAAEIIACGTPLLTARVGALALLLADSPECLYDPATPGGLARQIRGQLSRPTPARIEIPTWAAQARRLADFLARVAGPAAPGPA